MKTFNILDRIADFLGSITYLCILVGTILTYVIFNLFSPIKFDPIPFLGLNTCISVIALFGPNIILIVEKYKHRKTEKRFQEQAELLREINIKLTILMNTQNSIEVDKSFQ